MTKDQEYKLLFEKWNSYVDIQEQRSPISKDDQDAFEDSLSGTKRSNAKFKFQVEKLKSPATAKQIKDAIKNDLEYLEALGAAPMGDFSDQLERLICLILSNEGFFQMLTNTLEGAIEAEDDTSPTGSSISIGDHIQNALLSVVNGIVSATGYAVEKIMHEFMNCKEWKDVKKELERRANKKKDDSKKDDPKKDDPKKDEKTGITISFKGKPSSHGSKNSDKCVIPGMKNAKDLYPMLQRGGYFKVTPGNPERYGHPRLADVLLKAARKTGTKGKGVPIVNNISLERGGPIGPSTSHQVGLDVDCSYYFRNGSKWRDANKNFKHFSLKNNIIFMFMLTRDERVEKVYTDNGLMKKITSRMEKLKKDDPNNKLPNLWDLALKTEKLKHIRGHKDHYHIRVYHPPGSPVRDNVPCPNPGKSKQRQSKINVTTQPKTPLPRPPFRPGSPKY